MISSHWFECWHFKISSSFLGEMFWSPWFWHLGESHLDSQQFFNCQDFEISPRSYLKSCWDSLWVFGRWDFARILASFWPPRFWDLVKILVRISTRFWDLGEILSEFLATKILRSWQDSRRVFGRRDFEISPRYQNLAGQKLAKISVKILQGETLIFYSAFYLFKSKNAFKKSSVAIFYS